MGKAIGIDLGTTNSVVAFKDTSVRVITTGANNEDLCRSCVAMDRNSGQLVVGNAAYKQWRRYAPNIVVSAKRLMGGSISDEQVKRMKNDRESYPYGITQLSGGTDAVAIVLNGKEYTPEQISAEILKRLKEDASVKAEGGNKKGCRTGGSEGTAPPCRADGGSALLRCRQTFQRRQQSISRL